MNHDADFEDALETLNSEDLKEILREVIEICDDRLRAYVESQVVARAAQGSSTWRPKGHSAQRVHEAIRFAAAAKRKGSARGKDVDRYLHVASQAFYAKDFEPAHQVLTSLLAPLCDGEIDLGQHELLEEVLGTDLEDCAAQLAVSVYMLSRPEKRAQAVWDCTWQIPGLWQFEAPLKRMAKVAVEPLPDQEAFLSNWIHLLRSFSHSQTDWYDATRIRGWLREAIELSTGREGLAELARNSSRYDDLRAWVSSILEEGDLVATLAACDEASELAKRGVERAGFLDQGAQLARQLQRPDVEKRLRSAWRELPSFLRLCNWLVCADSKRGLEEKVGQAMRECPAGDNRQQALLLVLSLKFVEASGLLADAPGLGWSSDEHPGHLLFPLFLSLLAGDDLKTRRSIERDVGVFELDDSGLVNTVGRLVQTARIQAPRSSKVRRYMIAAMQVAAQKRVEGVTQNKRRRYYEHVACMVVACGVCMGRDGEGWVRELRSQYSQYPALQREMERGEPSGVFRFDRRALFVPLSGL